MILKIKKKKTKRASQASAKDPVKEGIFKGMVNLFEQAGIAVRREELKRGHGWKATSGFCIHNDVPTLFVDRLLPQDEQISFLAEQIKEFKLSTSEAAPSQ